LICDLFPFQSLELIDGSEFTDNKSPLFHFFSHFADNFFTHHQYFSFFSLFLFFLLVRIRRRRRERERGDLQKFSSRICEANDPLMEGRREKKTAVKSRKLHLHHRQRRRGWQ